MNGTATLPSIHDVAPAAVGLSTKPDITLALQIVHNPRSDTASRQQASDFLESQKNSPNAALCGYELAADSSQAAEVRHFGLSLLEHNVRHNWHSFSEGQALEVRNSVVALCQAVTDDDPLFLRNKVAHLLVELAKKDWIRTWYDFDSTLLQLWKQSTLYKELVLNVLEGLSEDVFVREDSAAAIRGQDFNNAVVEIFTPASAFAGSQNKRRIALRADDDGWLFRISQMLLGIPAGAGVDRSQKTCIQKALATMRSCFTWIMAPAIISTHCLESIFTCLKSTDQDILLAAIEALHSLFGRSHLDEAEFTALVSPVFEDELVGQLRGLYDWSKVECHDIDASKYIFSKKFSETVAFIAGHIEELPATQVSKLNLSSFLNFLLVVTQHQSLTVSIPVLHAWSRLLKTHFTNQSSVLLSVIGPLLDTARMRIIRYELFPEDSDDPSIQFLNEDIDTIPERHAFLGNYRRFCHQIVEIVAHVKPQAAITHVLTEVDSSLDALASITSRFDPATYHKSSDPLLQLDAHSTVVEAAFKGYTKWLSDHSRDAAEDGRRKELASTIEVWMVGVLERRRYGDPLMKQRIIKLAVDCSARALGSNQPFALKVLEHILLTQTADQPQYPAYSEAVKELQVYATSELRRLALRHADYFATFYEQLEAKIRDVLTTSKFDEKAEAEMYGTLLIVLQRANNIEASIRDERLRDLTASVLVGWESDHLENSLSTFEEFRRLLAVDRVGPYLQSRRADKASDWSTIQLDPTGLAIQDSMQNYVSLIPLRMTKTALGVMTDKVAPNSPAFEIAVKVWSPRIPMLLSRVLRLVQYAHRLHAQDTWPDVAPESRHVIARILQDRFWQAGISTGSRNDFYSRVTNTKASLEGFASFVRGRIRLVREASYQILHSMSRLGEQFYSYSELPGPLAEALLANTEDLSSHQFSVLLQMIRSMIDDCPSRYREHFLPPLLSSCFGQMDKKITSEWESVGRRKSENTGSDNLTAEMKEESILRQLTYTAVAFIAVLLDPLRETDQEQSSSNRRHSKQSDPPTKTPRYNSNTLRTFILSNPTILEPLLLFATHALTLPDSRSASTITKVLRTIVPAFALLSPSPQSSSTQSQPPQNTEPQDSPTTTAIREYLSSDVLKAAITALNDGYFVDQHKELSGLIATIWVAYGCVTHLPAVTVPGTSSSEGDGDGVPVVVIAPARDRQRLSETPRNVILSLPGMTSERVGAVEAALTATGGVGGQTKQQRALVLDLLDGLRGVRISELGKIDGRGSQAAPPQAGDKTRLQEKYMQVTSFVEGVDRGRMQGDEEGMEGVEGRIGVDLGDGPDLVGVGELLE